MRFRLEVIRMVATLLFAIRNNGSTHFVRAAFQILQNNAKTRFAIRKTTTTTTTTTSAINFPFWSTYFQRQTIRSVLTATAASDDASSEDSSNAAATPPTTASTETVPSEAYSNPKNRRDQVFSAISADGGIKVTACTVRNIVNDMMLQHTMTEVPAEALGRTVICGLLMANGIQDEQVVQITLNSDGPIRGVVAIVNGKGEVRGYVGTPALGDITLQDAIGKGSVQIVKNHPDWPRPYNGITAIRHGDVDRDIGIYLAESEQRSCALAAATSVNGILCNAAGGYLVEQLPGVSDETVEQVSKNLAKLVEQDGGEKLPTNLLLNGVTPLEIAEILLEGLDMQPLQQIEPKLSCECTEDRLFRALRLLPREEVEEILEKEEEVSARCHFCGKEYRMGATEVRKRLDAAKGDPAREDPSTA
jgi:molecular chaperone Hsp33